MSDLASWKVHGPVHTLRTEFAEWDLAREEWPAPRRVLWVRFLRDGRAAESKTHNPDGSVISSTYEYGADDRLQELRFGYDDGRTGKTLYSYDGSGRLVRVVSVEQDGAGHELETYTYGDGGRKTKVYFVQKGEPDVHFMCAVEGSEAAYSAEGAATIATVYDEAGRPGEVLFYDTAQSLLQRVRLTRDAAGQLVREELHPGEQPPKVREALENLPPQAREALSALLFGPKNATTYEYDSGGRLVERYEGMGELGGHRTRFRYDDRGNPIEERIENTSRDMEMDDEGNARLQNESFSNHDLRFDYHYDAHGNWTEQVVWIRREPSPDFQRSNIERREITYYD